MNRVSRINTGEPPAGYVQPWEKLRLRNVTVKDVRVTMLPENLLVCADHVEYDVREVLGSLACWTDLTIRSSGNKKGLPEGSKAKISKDGCEWVLTANKKTKKYESYSIEFTTLLADEDPV